MNNNKLTDERIAELFECVDMCDDMSIDENADMASALRELQQRRLADKNCFMYGIVNPDGQAHMDEFCVSCDIGLLETEVAALNSSEGTDGYRVVALYTALPLTDSERIELQERRKADSAEPIYQYRIRNGYNGQVTEWQTIRRDQVDFVLKAQPLNAEFRIISAPQPVPVVNEFIPKNLDRALGVVGMALPESKEEFNFQTERWIQRLIDRVIRYSDEFCEQPALVVQCPFPCGWDNLNKLAIQDAAFIALGLVGGEPVTESLRQAAISNNDRLLQVIASCRAATLKGDAK